MVLTATPFRFRSPSPHCLPAASRELTPGTRWNASAIGVTAIGVTAIGVTAAGGGPPPFPAHHPPRGDVQGARLRQPGSACAPPRNDAPLAGRLSGSLSAPTITRSPTGS